MVRTMTEGIVNRFLRSAKAEMLQKNETEIRCPCRRCKLKSLIADPDSGQVRDHLLLRGFMDGYRWQGDEDDYEVVHGGRARNEEGQQDNHRGSGGREDEESPGDDHDGDAVHSHHVEDAGHDDEEDAGADEGIIMKMKMPEQTMMDHRWAGCRTLIFKSCFSSRRITQELPPERKPRWINLS